MKLTKYIHSCVLLEEGGELLLIDPGSFTFLQGVRVELFKDVQTILLTHNHPDHIDPDAIRTIVSMGNARIVANGQIKEALTDQGIMADFCTDLKYSTEHFSIEAFPADHEPILAEAVPQNYAYLINRKVLATGDSFAPHLANVGDVQVLLLPITAPWCTELEVFDFAKAVAAKRVVPVHDGYAKDFFLKSRYENYKKYINAEGMKFEELANPGDSINI